MHVYVDYPEEKSERDIMLLVRGEEDVDSGPSASSVAEDKVAQQVIFDACKEIHAIHMAEGSSSTLSR
ncbi:MAG TPA: hypothetical protein VIX42_00610 [Edaphobacter sp.]